MEAFKKSLAETQAREKKAESAEVAEDGPLFSYAEFKKMFDAMGVGESSLRKSYAGLNELRRRKNLSWHRVRNLVQLGSTFGVEMLKNEGGTLKAARIPLTDRDWEQME